MGKGLFLKSLFDIVGLINKKNPQFNSVIEILLLKNIDKLIIIFILWPI